MCFIILVTIQSNAIFKVTLSFITENIITLKAYIVVIFKPIYLPNWIEIFHTKAVAKKQAFVTDK